MTIISDPTNLMAGNSDAASTAGAELTIDTTARTIKINPGSGDLALATDGVTFQALYSAFKLLWKNSSTYIKFPFPFEAITPEQFEVINGWTFFDATSRKAIRTAGWAERNSAGKIIAMFAGILSLGSLGATDQPYYQLTDATGAATSFAFAGPVNESVQVYSDPNGDGLFTGGYDRRGYFKLFAREQGKTYSSATIGDIGVTQLTYIAYRFPLANATDLKVTHSDAAIAAGVSTYGGVTLTYYTTDQVRSIGGVNYNYRVIISGNNQPAEMVYEKVQYLLRQNSDVDTGAGTQIGKVADSLLKFVGDTLVSSPGVYVDNFNANDTNRIEFWDTSGTKRTFPFVAAGSINFNGNLVSDPSAVYRMYFTTNPGGDFGTTNAILVNDANGNPVSGTISASSVSFSFAYDANVQGGRAAGADAAVTVVAIGLTTGQYVAATGTLTRSTGQSISLTAALERNYTNA